MPFRQAAAWPALLLGLLFWTAACGGPVMTADTPPTIVYGQDVCDLCGMIISDERFAAGLVVETAPNRFTQRIFDDIGDMVAYAALHGESETITAYFVHDYQSLVWIDARTATYVYSEQLQTPMGSGLAACADPAEAEELANRWQGKLLSFDELSQRTHGHAGH